jgi:hypothetical protein
MAKVITKRHRNYEIPLTKKLFTEAVVGLFKGTVKADEGRYIFITFSNADDRNNFFHDKNAIKLLSENDISVYETDHALTMRAI